MKKDYKKYFQILTNLKKDDINIYAIRPLGQAVKTPPSQGGIMGSIPVGVTKRGLLKEIIKIISFKSFICLL